MKATSDDRGTVDVSLYILSLNRAKYLAEAVKSALDQTHRPRDITILDNGSRPDVKTAMEPYLEKGVTWSGSDRTNSPFWNMRRAFKHAQGKYFVIMHDDDRLAKDFLKMQADFLDRNPEVVAVGCNAFRIDVEGNRGGPLLQRSKKEISWFRSSAEVALLYSSAITRYSSGFIPFPTIMYRNGSAQKIEFRDEEFGKVSDAIYLCDLAQIGSLAYQDKMLYEYRVHTDMDSMRLPEQIMRKRDQELLRYASSDPRILKRVRKNLATRQTLRMYSALGKRIRNDPEYFTLFDQTKHIRPEIFTVGGLFSGTVELNKKMFDRISRQRKPIPASTTPPKKPTGVRNQNQNNSKDEESEEVVPE